MKKIDRKNWQAKTEKLNKNIRLSPGMEVVDVEGYSGVVVQVREPQDDTDEGRIAVWQSGRFEYGGDNCEHYSYRDWKSFLRVKMEMKHGVDLTKDCYFYDDTGRTPYMYKLESVVAIEGDFCIAKVISTAPEWDVKPEK